MRGQQPADQAFRFRELLRRGDILKAKGLELDIDVAEIFS